MTIPWPVKPAAQTVGASIRVTPQAILAVALELAADSRQIAAYVPMPGEPGGPGLVAALSAIADVILPVLLPDLDLDWARYDGPASLRPSVAGGAHPGGDVAGGDT